MNLSKAGRSVRLFYYHRNLITSVILKISYFDLFFYKPLHFGMLNKVTDEHIVSRTLDYFLSDSTKLHTEIIFRDRNSETESFALNAARRKAIFIHGGGITGNHSIARRPALWLIHKGFFDEVILPDRRGCGESSPFTKVMTFCELAMDMKLLLDKMEIPGTVTAIASSYGGPVALALASMDKRIEKVILLASSPILTLTKGTLSIPYRLGILVPAIKSIIKFFTGGRNYDGYVDLDFVYDIKSIPGYISAQIAILRKIKKSSIQSMMLQVDSVFREENMCLPLDIKVNVPVVQVIGSRDSVWEKNIPARYLKNMPMFHQAIIKEASHKDIFRRAGEFLECAFRKDPEE